MKPIIPGLFNGDRPPEIGSAKLKKSSSIMMVNEK